MTRIFYVMALKQILAFPPCFYPNICPFPCSVNITNGTFIRWQSPQYLSCTALIEMSSNQSQEDEGEEVSESLEIPEKRERSPEESDPSLMTSSLSLPPSPNAAKGGRAKVEPAKIRPARRCLDNWNSEGHSDCSSSAPAYPRGFSLAPRPPCFSASSRASSSRTPLTPSLSPSSLSSVFNCWTFSLLIQENHWKIVVWLYAFLICLSVLYLTLAGDGSPTAANEPSTACQLCEAEKQQRAQKCN